MNQIKFSHHYVKLNRIDVTHPVTLVQIFLLGIHQLTNEFLDYDTIYYDGIEKKQYPLVKGMDCLLLLFVDSNGTLFTTIRRNTPEKEKYYLSKIGMKFEVVFDE